MITPWSECSQSCGSTTGFKVIIFVYQQHKSLFEKKNKNEKKNIALIFDSNAKPTAWSSWTTPRKALTMRCAKMPVFRCQTPSTDVANRSVRDGALVIGHSAKNHVALAITNRCKNVMFGVASAITKRWRTRNARRMIGRFRGKSATIRGVRHRGEWIRGRR